MSGQAVNIKPPLVYPEGYGSANYSHLHNHVAYKADERRLCSVHTPAQDRFHGIVENTFIQASSLKTLAEYRIQKQSGLAGVLLFSAIVIILSLGGVAASVSLFNVISRGYFILLFTAIFTPVFFLSMELKSRCEYYSDSRAMASWIPIFDDILKSNYTIATEQLAKKLEYPLQHGNSHVFLKESEIKGLELLLKAYPKLPYGLEAKHVFTSLYYAGQHLSRCYGEASSDALEPSFHLSSYHDGVDGWRSSAGDRFSYFNCMSIPQADSPRLQPNLLAKEFLVNIQRDSLRELGLDKPEEIERDLWGYWVRLKNQLAALETPLAEADIPDDIKTLIRELRDSLNTKSYETIAEKYNTLSRSITQPVFNNLQTHINQQLSANLYVRNN